MSKAGDVGCFLALSITNNTATTATLNFSDSALNQTYPSLPLSDDPLGYSGFLLQDEVSLPYFLGGYDASILFYGDADVVGSAQIEISNSTAGPWAVFSDPVINAPLAGTEVAIPSGLARFVRIHSLDALTGGPLRANLTRGTSFGPRSIS
jgi:hypothetical protein